MLLELMNNIDLLGMPAIFCGIVACFTSMISVVISYRKRMECLSQNEEAIKSKMEACKEVDSNVKIMLKEMGNERASKKK